MSEKFGEPWKCLHDCFHTQEGSSLGWNKAWRGELPQRSKQIIEFVAESPELARELAQNTVSVLNVFAGIEDPEAWVKAHRELVEAARRFYALPNLAGRVGPWLDIHNHLVEVKSALAACEAAEGRKG